VKGKIATANYLRGGEIVYFTDSGEWSSNLNDALIAFDDGAELLSSASMGEREQLVISLYLIDVEDTKDGLTVLSQRERIRATGPTV
tara:strand:+ start:3395 stop:3655 length:261 start_codon:yes stop_codon:yes gene_type:complete